jgi:phosphoesterase RecJ-like protein
LIINTSYEKAFDSLHKARYILIVTHLNPDADTLSSALALSNYLTEHKKKHKVFNKSKNLPNNLDHLHLFSKITHLEPKFYDLIVYMDCGDIERPGITFDSNITTLNFDHHESNNNFATYNIVDINKASTSEVLFDFFEKNQMEISKNGAECFYTGIYDDSLKFSTPRVDKSTFDKISFLLEKKIDPNYLAQQLIRRDSLAKYRLLPRVLDSLELHHEGKTATIYLLEEWLGTSGATIKDCDDAIDMILNIKIVDIVVFARVIKGKTRISLRSKNGATVNEIAKHFNGGGHTMAAGCSHPSADIDEVFKDILNFIQGDK